mmetsp:Transcript_17875/g.52203  ORF Transcript_17875/g.52203 Transcript_17875/m.52203 type:complete len:311 (-) Transcript_17875:734-1666(-)
MELSYVHRNPLEVWRRLNVYRPFKEDVSSPLGDTFHEDGLDGFLGHGLLPVHVNIWPQVHLEQVRNEVVIHNRIHSKQVETVALLVVPGSSIHAAWVEPLLLLGEGPECTPNGPSEGDPPGAWRAARHLAPHFLIHILQCEGLYCVADAGEDQFFIGCGGVIGRGGRKGEAAPKNVDAQVVLQRVPSDEDIDSHVELAPPIEERVNHKPLGDRVSLHVTRQGFRWDALFWTHEGQPCSTASVRGFDDPDRGSTVGVCHQGQPQVSLPCFTEREAFQYSFWAEVASLGFHQPGKILLVPRWQEERAVVTQG